ncbi:MAG TPA: hypothetical protein PK691_05480 [Thermomicrobiales bacterium]|nr:hypothetical protein [Thermomicrobiales bacterium]
MSIQSRNHRILPRSILAVILAAFVITQFGDATDARQKPDLETPVAFSTSATGLLPATGEDMAIGVASFTTEEGVVGDDPVAGLPGFIIVTDGRLVLLQGEGNAIANLEAGDAFWLSADETYQTVSKFGARFWRIGVGVGINASDWGGSDPYTFTTSGSGNADSDAVPPIFVRMGVIPTGASVSLGGSEENVIYVFALEGEISLDGKPLATGTFLSPFFNQPQAAATASAAYIGYLAIGQAINPSDGSAADGL